MLLLLILVRRLYIHVMSNITNKWQDNFWDWKMFLDIKGFDSSINIAKTLKKRSLLLKQAHVWYSIVYLKKV